jgi:DNA repair exonuclease SbcCD ATPase subunit
MKTISVVNGDENFNAFGLQKKIGNNKDVNKQQQNRNSIYAGDTTNAKMQEAYLKKARDQKKALKAVLDQFEKESSLDDEQKQRQKKIDELMGKSTETLSQISDLQARKQEIIETGAAVPGSKEEENIKEIDETIAKLYDDVKKNNQDSEVTLKTIRAVTMGRDKSHPMVDAENKSQEILQQASKDMINSLVEQSKDKVDEQMQDEKDEIKEADKKAEEKKKEEAKAAQKADNQEKAASSQDDSSSNMDTAVQSELDKQITQVKNQVAAKEILEEDIKGVAVDKQL